MSTNPNTEEQSIRTFTLQELQEAFYVGHNNAHLHIYATFEDWVRRAHNLNIQARPHGAT